MKARGKLLVGMGVMVVALALALVGRREAGANLLTNPSFEGGAHHWVIRCNPDGTCEQIEVPNIFSPEGWLTWFDHEKPCVDQWVTGQPEVKVIGPVPDPTRIYAGLWAVEFYTMWRCHDGGLLQRVVVEPGQCVQGSVMVHTWYSQCSTKPHSLPFKGDCVTPICTLIEGELVCQAHDWVMVGIDGTGGLDPRASTVAWGQPVEIYGQYDGPVYSPVVCAVGDKVTFYVRSVTSHPFKHCNVYWDLARLWQAWLQFLPLVHRGGK